MFSEDIDDQSTPKLNYAVYTLVHNAFWTKLESALTDNGRLSLEMTSSQCGHQRWIKYHLDPVIFRKDPVKKRVENALKAIGVTDEYIDFSGHPPGINQATQKFVINVENDPYDAKQRLLVEIYLPEDTILRKFLDHEDLVVMANKSADAHVNSLERYHDRRFGEHERALLISQARQYILQRTIIRNETGR